MKSLARLGIGCAAVAAVASVGLALVAPAFLREASQFVGPIREMERRQKALDAMADEVAWKPPDPEALSAAQLDRFFVVRQAAEAARRSASPSLDRLPRKKVDSLEELREVPGIIRGVTDVVGGEMDAMLKTRMPPAEYHWIERLVYQRWRGPLRKSGAYPIAQAAAAAELTRAAAGEPDARVRVRLERLAAEMNARRPDPPEGIAPWIHELLLGRIADVERHSLDDVVEPYVPIR